MHNNDARPKAYSYIRFSSSEQAKGDSYRRQSEAIKEYCKRNDLDLATSAEYTFLDRGKSAYKAEHVAENGQLKRFIDHVDSGRIKTGSYLIVESLDRLSREKANIALERFLGILNKGINVYTLMDQRLYSSENKNHTFELMASIVWMAQAHNESFSKGERVQKAWSEKKKQARETNKPLGKAVPYWLELKDGKYTVIEERAEVVRRIFQLCISGRGRTATGRILNNEKVPVFGSIARNKDGLWATTSIARILNSRQVLGEYQPTRLDKGKRVHDGQSVRNYFPRIITDDLFFQAQAAQQSRKDGKITRQSESFNLWQKVGQCDRCLGAMHLLNKGKAPKGYTYIACSNKKKGICDAAMIRQEKADLAFKEILAKVDSLSLVQDNEDSITTALDKASGELHTERQQLETKAELMNSHPSTTLAEQVSKHETRIKELESLITDKKKELSTNKITSKADFFSKLDIESYEGRSQANNLLKRLGVTVRIGYMDLPEGRRHFFTAGLAEENIISSFIVEISTVDFTSWQVHTNSSAIAALSLDQGDIKQRQLDRVKEWENLETEVEKILKHHH